VIAANLTATLVDDLFFGTLAQGQGSTVSTGGAAAGSATLGVFEIFHNSDVAVAVTPPAGITGPGGTIPVVFECGYSATGPTDATFAAFPGCAGLTNTGVTAPGTDQSTWVQVGGVIDGGNTSVQAGTYAATLTFNLTAVF
jgi:hypothetical protein